MTLPRVLVADPPWLFSDKLPGPGRGASKKYKCMALARICLFPLPPLAADAWLFMWRVGGMQEESLAVVRAWGFEQPTGELVWCKTTEDGSKIRMGMGRAAERKCHEICLIARRGRPKRLNANVKSVFFAPLGEHSAKPDKFYDVVERLVDGPYVELFARRHRGPGWTCHGDQLPPTPASPRRRSATPRASR